MRIKIPQIKKWREEIGATHMVVYAIDENGERHVATHGLTEQNAQESAKAGNKLKRALGWPEDLCQTRPLERLCKNCSFYEPDYGTHCFNGWTGDGSDGKCLLHPQRVKVKAKEKCGFFEPK